MTTTVEAIDENGKLLLPAPLPLPEKSHVLVTIETKDSSTPDADRVAWLKLSEKSLLKAWDNKEDDVFNELLSK